MEGKLIKLGEELFELHTQGFLKGSTNHDLIDSLNAEEGNIRYKISLTNCQAIERGYDLDELVENEENKHYALGLKHGFQKALEILGDKKFTEEDMRTAVYEGVKIGRGTPFVVPATDDYLKSLQQTEWGVTIETEITDVKLNYGATSFEDCHHVSATRLVKLDNEGRLILKRKK